LKVLTIITRGDAIGGAQTHVLTLSKLLIQGGHEVLVSFGGKDRGIFGTWLEEESIPFSLVPHLKRKISLFDDLRAMMELIQVVRNFKPDIITLHSSKAGILGRMLKLFFNIPILLTVHGWSFSPGIPTISSAFYSRLEKVASRFLDRIIVVSNFDYNLALNKSICSSDKLAIIHNGIANTAGYVDRVENDVVNLVMIARFDHQKDHISLIKACKEIQGIRLHLLGDGPQLDEIKNRVSAYGMNDMVEFWGQTKDVSQALQMADIFLLISNWEGFPISTLEAMNWGLPVIVSNVGGACEAVKDGVNGYCIPRGQIDLIKQKICFLRDNRTLRIEMGKQSKILFADHFSSEKMYEKTLGEYLLLTK
jgi:glycosyltransferase involved in cell wall biosynthesis